MDSGFYAACSGLAAKTRQLEVAAHNLANVSTTAFKSQQLSFHSLIEQSRSQLSVLNQSINEYGVASDPALDLSSGELQRTGNELDLAVEGKGYFVVQGERGSAYTRNGHFQVSAAGELTTVEGHRVAGDRGPIRVPPSARIDVGPDGTITAGGALVGKLKVVEFKPDARLVELSPGEFASDGSPVNAASSLVRQGSLESSNVNGVEAAVGLIAIQRHAEMLQRAMTMFHSELNRIATGELSRL